MHPKKQYNIFIWDIKIGHGGVLHPIVCEDIGIDPALEVDIVEVDLWLLVDVGSRSDKFIDYYTNQDQILYRDLAFVMDVHQDFNAIKEAVLSVDQVEDMHIFDVFRIDADSKSIGIKIKIIWDWEMKIEDINEVMQSVISSVEKTWAALRWPNWEW